MALDSREDFFGCKLSKDDKEYVWSAPEESEDDIEHKLQITQACLGVNAKQGERNVIDVTTENAFDEEITHTILSLQLGLTDMSRLELGFLNKTTFKLVKGNGPVHLTGLHMQAAFPGGDSEDDEDEDLESSDEEAVPNLVKMAAAASDKKVEEKKQPKAAAKIEEKKQPKAAAKIEPKKVAKAEAKTNVPKKVTAVEAKVEEDEDSDEDEDDEVAEKVKDLMDDEADDDDMDSEEEDEEESDDDDELDDDDDLEDEDMSDEEDESEEEEAVKPPSSKKAKITVNGHKDAKNKTPSKKAEEPPKGKQNTPQPEKKVAVTKTPKSDKKAEKEAKTPTAVLSVEEVKKKLLKSPNLPKTAEKFKNFMKSAYKITDDDSIKSVWDFVQKSKK